MRSVVVIAGCKAALSVVLLTLDWRSAFDVSSQPIPPIVFAAQILAFGTGAAWLWIGGRDPRAFNLAGFFAIIASSFGGASIQSFASTLRTAHPALASVLRGASAIQPDAFLPFFLWLFVRDFPDAPSFDRPARLPGAFATASAFIGLFLFVVNIYTSALPSAPLVHWFEAFGRAHRNPALYWLLVFGLAIPSLPLVAWKSRRARIQERRRVGIFTAGLVVGFGPIVVEVLLESVVPPFRGLMGTRRARQAGGLILYPLLLSIPVTTAYAIVVDRVLDVRIVVRKAVQYALAKYSLLIAALAPVGALVWIGYRKRHEPLAAIMSPGSSVPLAWAVTTSALLLTRRRVLEGIDRRFFREEYDARQILSAVAREAATVASAISLAESITAQLDRALHLYFVFLLISDGVDFVDPLNATTPLPGSSSLLSRLRPSTPLAIDLDSNCGEDRWIDDRDREWLAHRDIELLVPVHGRDGHVIGVIGLGGKRSQLPFSRDDRELLTDVAASAALAIEGLRRRGSDKLPQAVADERAQMCPRCEIILPSEARTCPDCRITTEQVPLPHVLFGKFQFVRRLGAGGMGVVYLALDLTLNRRVAVKTLPQMLPKYAIRLQREARTMAAFVHPNLALIFGAEAWKGLPLLVEEYLSGGTLSGRLKSGRCSVDEGLRIGTTLARALEFLHGRGVLHCDIKPSNIGFDSGNTVKLLDFGLAAIIGELRATHATSQARSSDTTEALNAQTAHLTDDDMLVGTPAYLAPEVLERRVPDPGIDLWSLAIAIFEAVSGVNPFRGRDLMETLDKILHTDAPDIRQYSPTCPAPVADFFRAALSRNRRHRPATARELRYRMEGLLRDWPGLHMTEPV